jgi:hypothetical protein
MAAIPSNFGTGGSGLNPNDATGKPTLATILRDLADDVTYTIASADATDLASAITLVNEIKAALNAAKATTKA